MSLKIGKIQLFPLSIIALTSLSGSFAFADHGEYLTELKKMKNPSPEARKELARKTIFEQKAKKWDEVSRRNDAAYQASQQKTLAISDSKGTSSASKSVATTKNSRPASPSTSDQHTPVKVSHDTPDELNFPGQ